MGRDKAMSPSARAKLAIPFTGYCRCRWPGCCETGPASPARPVALQSEGLSNRAGAAASCTPLLFSCFMRGLTLTGKGDYDEALASFNEGLSLAERIGDEGIHHRLLNCLGGCCGPWGPRPR